MNPFFLFFALLGVFAVVMVPIGFLTWVSQLRNTPAPPPGPFTEFQNRAFVRRAFQRPLDFDPDEGMRQLAALITEED